MKRVTLNIEESKFHAFLEFIKTLDYVRIHQESKKTSKFVEELESSLTQVKQIKEGKLPKQSAKDFLNEL